MSNILSIVRNPPKWRSKQLCNQVNFFFGSREDRLNLSCGEPESCYFRKNGEEGRTKWISSAGRSEDQKRVNQPCGEPESGYFRKNGEKGWTKLVSSAGRSEDQREIEPAVWGTRVGLLQEEWRERNSWTDCRSSQSCSTSKRPPSDRPFRGNSFQDWKIKWRRADKSRRVQPWGRGFFHS